MPLQKQFDIDGALEKAMLAFWNRGYEATSIQDLVDCMGVNRGSLYATFGDKHDLFVATLKKYDFKNRKQSLQQFEAQSDPCQAIRLVFDAFVQATPDNQPSKGCFLTNSALELAAHDPEIQIIVAHAQKEIENFFCRMIEKGKKNGQILRSVKTSNTSGSLLATLQGLIVLSRSRPDRAFLQSIVDDALDRIC